MGGDLQRLLLPFSYAQEGLKTVQRATQQVLEVTEESAQQGLRVAEEATEQTDKVLRKTEKVAREAELRTAVFGALKTADYDGFDRRRDLQEARRSLRRGAQEGPRVREAQQES